MRSSRANPFPKTRSVYRPAARPTKWNRPRALSSAVLPRKIPSGCAARSAISPAGERETQTSFALHGVPASRGTTRPISDAPGTTRTAPRSSTRPVCHASASQMYDAHPFTLIERSQVPAGTLPSNRPPDIAAFADTQGSVLPGERQRRSTSLLSSVPPPTADTCPETVTIGRIRRTCDSAPSGR